MEAIEQDSFLRNCAIGGREEDGPLFVKDGDRMCCRLDGYAVLPIEQYEELKASAEKQEHYGWSLIDSNGVTASCIIFKNLKEANRYKKRLNELHPERKCEPVELFVKSRLD